MRTFFKTVVFISFILIFTVLTQVGGLILLLSWPIVSRVKRKFPQLRYKIIYNVLIFSVLYTFASILIIPPLAATFGRVPLPMWSNQHLQPRNIWTCILNRHYVRPNLKIAMEKVSRQVNQAFPGTITHYLDAGFPFWDKFPMLPHLGHKDGKKLDLAFYYLDKSTQKPSNQHPSLSGYGVFEEPLPSEWNQPKICAQQGYTWYGFSKNLNGWNYKNYYLFDNERTRALINYLTNEPSIALMYLEPHLKIRLGMANNAKIAYHGCFSVRHDDHLHIQIW
jgi:hypothetical protein